MLPDRVTRYFNPRCGFFLALALTLAGGDPARSQDYRTTIIEEGAAPSVPEEILPEMETPSLEFPTPPSVPLPVPTNPNDLRSLSQPDSLLSMQGGQRLMAEANSAVGVENYTLAVQKLQEARQVFNQLSGFYSQLADSFSGIDNRISEAQRDNALSTAEMRDRATYQLALVHRAQERPELAVPLLIQIVRSQNPTTDLGKKAYQQLFELGFVDSPYPRPRAVQSTPPTSSR
jgi:hypothetical protein